MMFLPWRRASFTCYACGMCCYHFIVPLKPLEAKVLASMGVRLMSIKGKVYIAKEVGKPCPLLRKTGEHSLCILDPLGLKPTACKLWPFYVYERPVYGFADEAHISYRGSFYVYLDRRCPGVRLGVASRKMEEAVKEAIDIWLGVRREQRLTHMSFSPPHQGSEGSDRNSLKGPPPKLLKRDLSY